MKKELGRLLATGAIIGAGALGADNNTVSAGGGPQGTTGFSSSVERQNYMIGIPNPPEGAIPSPEFFTVFSKTEDKKVTFNWKPPFRHVGKTGNRGRDEGIKELAENCQVVSAKKIYDGFAEVRVKDRQRCFTIFKAQAK